MRTRALVLMLIPILSIGCLFFADCDILIPQKWHIGKLEADFITRKPILKVGDTILFAFRLERNLLDIDSQEMDIDLGIQVFNKISTTSNLSDTTHAEVFAIDTTIYKVFDQYFDVNLIKGKSINAYTYDCQLTGNTWEVEIQYIPKKTGNYWARIEVMKISTSQSELGEGVCMEGDPEAFGAKLVWNDSENNRIDYLFQKEKLEYPDYFGFIVEE